MKNFDPDKFGYLKPDAYLVEANTKFLNGDGIDNKELATLLVFYRNAEGILQALGTAFHIAWVPVSQRLRTLEGFWDSRCRKDGLV